MFGRPGTLQRARPTTTKKLQPSQAKPKQYRPFHMWAKLFQGPIVLVDQKFEIKLTIQHSPQNKQIVKLIDDNTRILVLYADGQVDTHFLKFLDGKPLTVQTNSDWSVREYNLFQILPNNRFCVGCHLCSVEIFSSTERLFRIRAHTGKITNLFVLRNGNIISTGEKIIVVEPPVRFIRHRTIDEVKHIDVETQNVKEYKSVQNVTSMIELDSGLLMFTKEYSIFLFDRHQDIIITEISCLQGPPQSLTHLGTRLVYWDGEKFQVLQHNKSIVTPNWMRISSFYHHGDQQTHRDITMHKVDEDCALTVSPDGIVNATDVTTCRCYFKYESKTTEISRQVDLGPRPPELEIEQGRAVIGLAHAWGVQTVIDRGPLMVVLGVHTTKEDRQWVVANRLACLQDYILKDLLQIVVDYWV